MLSLLDSLMMILFLILTAQHQTANHFVSSNGVKVHHLFYHDDHHDGGDDDIGPPFFKHK